MNQRPRNFSTIVPKRYELACGVSRYRFKILIEPYYNSKYFKERGEIFFRYRAGNKYKDIWLKRDSDPKRYDAITETGFALIHSPYPERYMRLYKAHEAIATHIDIKSKSIRHALSHSQKALSNRTTIQTLSELFGTVHIDFENPGHRRTFFQQLFELYKQHDILLFTYLQTFLNLCRNQAHPTIVELPN